MLCPFSLGDFMRGLSREERKQLRANVVEYRKQDHTIKECCEHFGITKSYVYMACKGIKYDWKYDREACIAAAKAWAASRPVDESVAIGYIERFLPWAEYAGGYTNCDGHMDVRCKKCGTVRNVSCVSVRQGKNCICKNCQSIARAEEKRKASEAKRQEAKYQRSITYKTRQLSLKICPVCHSVFVGSNKYCSERCRHHNKWTMREGYRYLFPLEDVYERSNGVCYICGRTCDWNDYTVKNGVKIYGNRYPSRDHVVPKSKGGKNEWSNIKLACRLCNSMKGSAPIAQ